MEVKWPWVSRHRLERAEQQLEDANKEKRELLDRLLGGTEDRQRLARQVRQAQEDETEPVEQGNVTQFSTPFDRIEQRFDAARKAGQPISPKFKARA